MLVPLSWLREFTPYDGSAQDLGDKLTMLGLELEEIINPFAGLKDIVVGFVADCVPHPDSDHMHCCKVDIGGPEILDIVCGAPNVAQGQKVAVAPVGANLPDGTQIKKAKLRGQPSFGMICSERELGLSEDHSGIMILPESADVGHKLVDALDLDREVLDLSITPNRGDCLSILGIARETAIAFNLPLHVPANPLIMDSKAQEMVVPVEIENPDLCWLYSGTVITNVTVQPSPMRMRYRLLAVGVRPISNIVDITNYVLFEVGQPLHAFDLDKLAGGKIIVRPAKKGERLVTLDGKDRSLAESDLCICDAERIVGLAGVMGGLDTEITGSSKKVFLESAVFRPETIRRTSRRLGLVSEASFRFERGVDEQRTIWALDRACALMASIGGGFPIKSFTVNEPRPFIAAKITYDPQNASQLLGLELPRDFQLDTLNKVGCAIENSSQTPWIAIQPSWRHDLTREADLIEEVGRIYGLDKIEPTLPCACKTIENIEGLDSWPEFIRHIRHWGSGIGLNEIISYSFVGQKDLDFCNLPREDRIAIKNPLSEEQDVLRTCLTPGLLQAMANNLAFAAPSIKLFEIASAFKANASEETGATEIPLLGIVLSGLRHAPRWPHAEEFMDYADLKGLAENLCEYLGIPAPAFTQNDAHPFLSPCVSMTVEEHMLANLGQVKASISGKYNAQKPVWLGEFRLDALRDLRAAHVRKFVPLAVYPGVKRDITVITPSDMRIGVILDAIKSIKLPLLEDAWLYDVYEPKDRAEKNLTFRLAFRHSGRTLKDEEVDKEREKVAEFLKTKLHVNI